MDTFAILLFFCEKIIISLIFFMKNKKNISAIQNQRFVIIPYFGKLNNKEYRKMLFINEMYKYPFRKWLSHKKAKSFLAGGR